MKTSLTLSDTGNALRPELLRLLNKPSLCKGRSALPVSNRRRESIERQDKEQQAFNEQHPWWRRLEGYEREIFRRLHFSIQRRGPKNHANRFEYMFFVAGDIFGKEVIWPILNHLLEGGSFEIHGMEIHSPHPVPQEPQPAPLLEFLSSTLPAGTPEKKYFMLQLLLKAAANAERIVESTLAKLDEEEKSQRSAAAGAAPPG